MAAALAQDSARSYSTSSLRGGLLLAEGAATAAPAALAGVTLKKVNAAGLYGATAKAAFA